MRRKTTKSTLSRRDRRRWRRDFGRGLDDGLVVSPVLSSPISLSDLALDDVEFRLALKAFSAKGYFSITLFPTASIFHVHVLMLASFLPCGRGGCGGVVYSARAAIARRTRRRGCVRGVTLGDCTGYRLTCCGHACIP